MFRKFVLKNPYQLFLTILLPFLVSTVLLLFLQSSLLNRNFEKFALSQVYHQQVTDLQNTSQNVSVLEQTARSVSTTAFFDDVIKDLLYTDVAPDDYFKYQNKLQSYKNIYPFLQSIYVYNGDHIHAVPMPEFSYDRGSFADKGIFDILDDIQNHRSHSIVLRKIPNVLAGISTGAPESIYVYSYLFFDSQVSSGKVNEAIILNISADWLKQSIQPLSGESGGGGGSRESRESGNRIFIIDSKGELLSDDSVHPLLTDLHDQAYIKQINGSKEHSGSLRMDVDGVDSFITYTSTDAFDWKLVSITPYRFIVKDVEKMKEKTYLLVVLFIVGSILLSFYFARRLFVPISMVIQNYNQLELEKRSEFYDRKQEFLRKVIQSRVLLTREYLQSQFHKYAITLDPAGSFLLVLLKIDRFPELCRKYSRGDRDLLKFGVVNIVTELLAPAYAHECIETDEDQVMILLQVHGLHEPSGNRGLVQILEQIQQQTHRYLRFTASITCSEPFESITQLNFHYLKTVDLSYYRLIYGYESMVFSETISGRTDEIKYPQERDDELTEALIGGRFEDAKQALNGIVAGASTYSYTALNSLFIRLLLLIRYAIEVLESNHAMKVDFNFNAYLMKLQKMETVGQVLTDFFELFDSLAMELEAKKDNKYVKLLGTVTQIIQRDLANPALSLDSIAEEVDLSPAYLGKLFKKHRLVSVADYINNARLEYATQLVVSSKDTITDIMEKSGFSSRSHFFTQFKKVYGITPSQYRTNAKQMG
ncbi:AraC-like DNA-binding protein [Paenibacillus taihuensis]|uniref:AraC-like DNA-binding protein n=1 Tax=Paenibacillus taihuensis TaxID=1156355 RepID=A0A3D9R0C9_9BACL|nr:AraC family transcriptional regulator [Paenibacillus taihuensis]REE66692.1 AraC-like DNA-binding protein [Paenibacillus taihuensis]